MSYVLCRAHIGLVPSEKEVFLEFFEGLLPENGDVEQKRYFLELYVYFQIIFLAFQLCCSPMPFRRYDFLLLKNCPRKLTIFIKVHYILSTYAENLVRF